MKNDTESLIDEAYRNLAYIADKHKIGEYDDLDQSDIDKLLQIIDQFHDLDGVEV